MSANVQCTTEWKHGPGRGEGTLTVHMPNSPTQGEQPQIHVQIMQKSHAQPCSWGLLASFQSNECSVTVERECFGDYRDAQQAGKNSMLDILTMLLNPVRQVAPAPEPEAASEQPA